MYKQMYDFASMCEYLMCTIYTICCIASKYVCIVHVSVYACVHFLLLIIFISSHFFLCVHSMHMYVYICICMHVYMLHIYIYSICIYLYMCILMYCQYSYAHSDCKIMR